MRLPVASILIRLLITVISIFVFDNSNGQYRIEFQKCFGGSSWDNAEAIERTADGGYIIAGGTGSNDGDVSGLHGGPNDIWVVKLDSAFNIKWQKCFGGSGMEYMTSLCPTKDNGFLIAATTNSFDGDLANCVGGGGSWLVKIDSIGNIQWQKRYGAVYYSELSSVATTIDGGYIAAGWRKNSPLTGYLDGDDYWILRLDSLGNMIWENFLGGSEMDRACKVVQKPDGEFLVAGTINSNNGYTFMNHGSSDNFVVRLDSSGTVKWFRCYGGSNQDEAASLKLTNDGGFILAGRSWSNDGNVSGNNGFMDYSVIKVSPTGIVEWQRSLGGSNWEEAYDIILTLDGGYLVSGVATSNDGFVTGFHDSTDCWVVKLDSAGNFEWQKCFGGMGYDRILNAIQLPDSTFILAGSTSSNDGDISNNHGYYDALIVKLSNKFNSITGKLFADLNSNSLHDSNEPFLENQKVFEQTTGFFDYSASDGTFEIPTDHKGNFTVIAPAINYYLPTPSSYSVFFSGLNQKDSLNDFPYSPLSAVNDLCISISPLTAFRPGFEASYMIDFQNVGTTIMNGSVNLMLDDSLSFITSSVTPSMFFADSIVWNFTALKPFECSSILVKVKISKYSNNGSQVNTSVKINPLSGDANLRCNYSEWKSTVTGSFDPNEILVDKDTLYEFELANNPTLDYVIYFQNTGTDTAFNIRVSNPVSNKLDINSFEFIAASHPVKIKYQNEQHSFDFTFNNILLPDSNTDEVNSHGFIRYRIQPNQVLKSGDVISNNAGIYFDFNAPVLTNNALTRIVNPNGAAPESKLLVFPNPTKDYATIKFENNCFINGRINISDLYGRIIYNSDCEFLREIKIDVSQYAKGVYLINLNSGSYQFKTKLMLIE